jgi:hypothetical protein
MADISDIWASMKLDETDKISEYTQRMSSIKSKSSREEVSIQDLIRKEERQRAKAQKAKAAEVADAVQTAVPAAKKAGKKKEERAHPDDKAVSVGAHAVVESANPPPASSEAKSSVEIITTVGRLMEALKDEDKVVRRSSLVKIHKLLFADGSVLSAAEYSMLFRDNCKSLFKLFSDPVEKCREMSALITLGFAEASTDFVSVLGYLMPCIMQRLPQSLAYDEEMKVFVTDLEAHEAYRRGRAVDRQDKTGTVGAASHTVIETAEEIRFIMAKIMFALLQRSISMGAAMILSPYFHEIILFFQYHLSDPFPDLKMLACNALELLAQVPEYESGMKFFAVGLVRAVLPVLRHRHAKVRLSAVTALRYCMCVPDRAKMKGSGTEAIPDLVGFREDNVLQVAAFYKVDVQINYLAELAGDSSVSVREEVAKMLTMFLTELGDRYDHQTRLLPYLLDLLVDEAPSVATVAMNCLKLCGRQYEEEHQDEIIERRQYGVDGDTRINLEKPLPLPFTERPRLGVRLYIRGNTKRFLNALVNELTNWQANTRIKSVSLLKLIVVACEEHLTIEAHSLLPSFIIALTYAKNDGDKDLQAALCEMFELFGRYLLPETYVHFVLPRLRGDRDVVQFAVDVVTRESVLQLLQGLLMGSKLSQILPHFEAIVDTLCDPFVVDPQSSRLMLATLTLLSELLGAARGKGRALLESHFMNTGRLSSLKKIIQKLLRFFLTFLGDSSLNKIVSKCILYLAELDCDSTDTVLTSVRKLFGVYGGKVFAAALADYDSSEMWSADYAERRILLALLRCPWLASFLTEELVVTSLQLFVNVASLLTATNSQFDNLASISTELARLVRIGVNGDNSSESVCSDYAVICESTVNRHRESVLAGVNCNSIRAALFDSNNQACMTTVVNTFVLHNIWSHNSKLLECRMSLLSQLFVRDLENSGSLPLVCAANTSPMRCLYVVSSAAVQPVNAFATRMHGAQLLLSSVESLDCSTMDDGIVRLSSFGAYNKHPEKYDSRLTSSQKLFLEDKASVQACLRLALDTLNDSSDDIRLIAIETVSAAALARLIAEDAAAAPAVVTYSALLTKVLNQVISVASESMLASLDVCLRNLATLEPTTFEAVVRSNLPMLLGPPEQRLNWSSEDTLSMTRSEFISALIDHCQLMCQFHHN